MADNVTSTTVNDGRYLVVHLTNESDGTGESAVAKVDISTFTDPHGNTGTYSAIDRIDYSVWGFNYVTLSWDATTDDEIAVLKGNGVIDFTPEGGKVDPKSSGTTGDIKLTTDGGADGSGYDILIRMRVKA